MSVYLGNINPGHVRAEMATSVVRAVSEVAISFVWLKQSPPYLDIHRNVVVEDFLNRDQEDKLLFVDSDVEFEPDHIRMLDAVDVDLVSGWYRNPNSASGKLQPVLYHWGYNGEYTQMIQYETDDDIEGLPEVQDRVSIVGAGGTGFTMISRTLLKKMAETFEAPQPWFTEQGVVGAEGEGPVWHGEDLMFGLRAAQLGFEWHVHKDARVPHYKTAKI